MSWDELLAYCLAKPGAWRDEPWGDGVVTKVGPKIFAFLGVPAGRRRGRGVGLKCGATREAADEWLLRFPDDATVMPYIGRSGWNNLAIGGAIDDDEVLEAVDASYAMVVSKLPKKDRPALTAVSGPQPPIASSSATVSASSVSDALATFSRRCATDDVPGISSRLGDRCSSQASATAIGVAPSRAATAFSSSDCSGLNPPSGK